MTTGSADCDDLKCPRCGHVPEAEAEYAGFGWWDYVPEDRDRMEGYDTCEECGWHIEEPWVCTECENDLPEDHDWEAPLLCDLCAADIAAGILTPRAVPA